MCEEVSPLRVSTIIASADDEFFVAIEFIYVQSRLRRMTRRVRERGTNKQNLNFIIMFRIAFFCAMVARWPPSIIARLSESEEWNYQFVIAVVRTCAVQMFIVAVCKLCASSRMRHDSRRGRNTSEMCGEIITLCHDVLRRGDNIQHRFFTWTMNFDRRLLQEEGK